MSAARALFVGLVAVLLAVGVVSALPASAGPAPIVVSIGGNTGLERETVTGSVSLPVTLSEPATTPVVVSFYTVAGTALSNVDYSRWGTPTSPKTVTIPTGSRQTSIGVPILADSVRELNAEVFSVVISSVSGTNVTLGSNSTGVAYIVDSDNLADAAEGSPQLLTTNPGVVEGNSGTRVASFQIQMSRAAASSVTLSYRTTIDGIPSFATPSDYKPVSGNVTLAAGQISKTIDVLVYPDTTSEGNESFRLSVDVVGGAPVYELASADGIGTIIDDDAVVPCAPGTYSATGNAPCTPAPPGFFVDDAGATSATPCAAGSFQPSIGQSSCLLAPIGSYVPLVGSTTATTCPPGTTTAAQGATLLSDCVPPTPAGALEVAAGGFHSCALLPEASVACWGLNHLGQLGIGTSGFGTESYVPVPVPGLTDVVEVSLGQFHTCALLGDGSVSCWGGNALGQLGDGTNVDSPVPVVVSTITNAVAISSGSGGLHTCALLAGGTVSCWGQNLEGELGDGTNVDSSVPVAVSGITDAVAVSAGGIQTCALLADSTISCWGDNTFGQLGDSTNVSSNVPVAVTGITDAVSVSVGVVHACAQLSDGTAVCWGNNDSGQLGNATDGLGTESNVPVAVQGISDASVVESGGFHSCAILEGGTASCWGQNRYGQLGNGESGVNVVSNVAVLVTGVTDADSISVGDGHTCAVRGGDAIWCWGYNVAGQLGDGTNGDASLPVAVSGF